MRPRRRPTAHPIPLPTPPPTTTRAHAPKEEANRSPNSTPTTDDDDEGACARGGGGDQPLTQNPLQPPTTTRAHASAPEPEQPQPNSTSAGQKAASAVNPQRPKTAAPKPRQPRRLMLLEIKNGGFPKIGKGSTPLKAASAESAPVKTTKNSLPQTRCCNSRRAPKLASARVKYAPPKTTSATYRQKPATSATAKSASAKATPPASAPPKNSFPQIRHSQNWQEKPPQSTLHSKSHLPPKARHLGHGQIRLRKTNLTRKRCHQKTASARSATPKIGRKIPPKHAAFENPCRPKSYFPPPKMP